MTNQISQKQAVIDGVKSILGTNFNILKPAKEQLTADQMKLLKSTIVDGIKNATISYSGILSDSDAIERYVPGLISNHFRKSKELNGGVQHTPTVSKLKTTKTNDSMLMELDKLLSTTEVNSDEHATILVAIEQRRQELGISAPLPKRPKSQKSHIPKDMDYNLLPDQNLKDFIDSFQE